MTIISRILKWLRYKEVSEPKAVQATPKLELATKQYQTPVYEDLKSNLTARVACSYWIKEITNSSDALICSIDANGYLREKSLRFLIANYHPAYANRILLRF